MVLALFSNVSTGKTLCPLFINEYQERVFSSKKVSNFVELSLDYGGSTAGYSYTPRVARSTTTRSTVSVKTKTTRSKRLKQITLAEVNARIRTARDEILENDDKSGENSIFDEAVAEGVPENILNRMKGAFSAIKSDYEYDTGKLFIVKFVSEKHQKAVIKLSTHFDIFSEAHNRGFYSSGGNIRLNLLNAKMEYPESEMLSQMQSWNLQ